MEIGKLFFRQIFFLFLLFSAYGKFIEDPSRYTNNHFVAPEKAINYQKKAMFRTLNEFILDDESLELVEVQMNKAKIEDNKAICIGSAILQYSKLRFLQFVYFLEKYLNEGSYRFLYADTDSIGIGTSKTKKIDENDTLLEKMKKIFIPIVKPSLKEEFLSKWQDYFVLDDTIEQKRKPGLLKSKNTFSFNNFVYYIQT